ncbi:MAG: BamA/TamA family outer membrane protein [Bacteroidales bacterium]|nr:BamA/TamA family outer membrane protein [Bacteroidales bacterium]
MRIRKTSFAFVLIMSASSIALYGQADTLKSAVKEDKIKTGWNFGALPAIAYDTDIGFKYGALVNLFYYGDGKQYPKYLHSLYFEWNHTTKGSGLSQFTYDSEHLIPGIRVSAEASYMTEQALDFYGFNGYESGYHAYLEDEDSEDYLSRVFYNMDRRLLRIRADFQGKVSGKKLRWLAGFEFNKANMGTVDIDKLNKGKDTEDQLPDTALLFDKYVEWGIIPEDEADGGNTTLLKAGLVYDTRDIEPNPMKGMWTELQFLLAPGFLGNGDLAYTRMAFTHRQYFTLAPEVLSFAYRLSYQTKLSGDMPYYMLPFVYNTAPNYTRDGLGGAKTIRGVMRNRIVGDGFVYGNLEFRWKFLRTIVFNQNLYLALSGFLDGGMVTDPYDFNIDPAVDPTEYANLVNSGTEKLHLGAGGGLHIVMNQNFIIAVDYGRALDPEDGVSGLYIGLNFLY